MFKVFIAIPIYSEPATVFSLHTMKVYNEAYTASCLQQLDAVDHIIYNIKHKNLQIV